MALLSQQRFRIGLGAHTKVNFLGRNSVGEAGGVKFKSCLDAIEGAGGSFKTMSLPPRRASHRLAPPEGAGGIIWRTARGEE